MHREVKPDSMELDPSGGAGAVLRGLQLRHGGKPLSLWGHERTVVVDVRLVICFHGITVLLSV